MRMFKFLIMVLKFVATRSHDADCDYDHVFLVFFVLFVFLVFFVYSFLHDNDCDYYHDINRGDTRESRVTRG